MSYFTKQLQIIHQRIDQDIRRELARAMPDQLRLRHLKKMKLRIKDQLYSLTQESLDVRPPGHSVAGMQPVRRMA